MNFSFRASSYVLAISVSLLLFINNKDFAFATIYTKTISVVGIEPDIGGVGVGGNGIVGGPNSFFADSLTPVKDLIGTITYTFELSGLINPPSRVNLRTGQNPITLEHFAEWDMEIGTSNGISLAKVSWNFNGKTSEYSVFSPTPSILLDPDSENVLEPDNENHVRNNVMGVRARNNASSNHQLNLVGNFIRCSAEDVCVDVASAVNFRNPVNFIPLVQGIGVSEESLKLLLDEVFANITVIVFRGRSQNGPGGRIIEDVTVKPVAPENIIILTHGWQPGVDQSLIGTSRLPEVRQALEQRLIDEDIQDKTLIIEESWPEAFVSGVVVPSFEPTSNYLFSYRRTRQVGNRIALKLLSLIQENRKNDPNYDPQIHFIGHSLGTMVNAYAVERLLREGQLDTNNRVTVEQVTILDDPLGVDRNWFYDFMPFLSVGFVENFYATTFVGSLPRVGDSIPGTFPCVPSSGGTLLCQGEQAPNTTHNQVHTGFYANRIGSSAWESPVLPGWNPEIAWDPQTARLNLQEEVIFVDGEAFTISPLTAQVIEVSPGRFVLRTNSPASIGGVNSMPEDLQYIRFKFADLDPSISASLTLMFDDLILWDGTNEDELNSEAGEIMIPASFISGKTGLLKWELNNLSEISVEVTLHDIEFGRVVQIDNQPDLLPGDLNGDQVLDNADFGFFLSTFGRCTGTPEFIELADFDDDGCITFIDYQTWYGLFTAQ